MWKLVLIIFFSTQFTGCKGATKKDYYNLFESIFTAYNPQIRPVELDTDPVKVEIKFNLISINELNEREQTLYTFGYLGLFWNDSLLSWENTTYSHVPGLVVPQARVWKPDVVVRNSVKRQTQLGYNERLLRIYSDGEVTWHSGELFSSACDISIRYYPFDTQNCIIQLETSVYQNDEIVFSIVEDTVDLSEYGENGQWELISTAITKGDSTYNDIVNIHLSMKRRQSFYMLNIILPIIILSCIGSLVFVLPADSGEKMSLAITILLSYIVFLTLISENLPQTSLQTSILSVYVTVLVAMSSSSVIFSTIVLRFYHRDTAVPRFVVWSVMTMNCERKKMKPASSISPIGKMNDAESLAETNGNEMVSWKDVSVAVDSLFFIISIIATIVISVVCLVLLIWG